MTANNRRQNETPDDVAAEAVLFDNQGRPDPTHTEEINKVILNTAVYTDTVGVVQSAVKTSVTPIVHKAATVVARAATRSKLLS